MAPVRAGFQSGELSQTFGLPMAGVCFPLFGYGVSGTKKKVCLLYTSTPVMYTEEYQVEYYKVNHEVADSLENFVGEQVWNFADFATSQSLLRVQGNKKGIFTRDRKPKLVAHYLRDRWTKIPEFGYKK